MKQIEISDEAYQTLTKYHGDVKAYVENLAVEAREVEFVQEGIDAYNAGDCRPLTEFGGELQERFGINTPKA
ncbi:hypothetical protein [Bythopirellula polymerisocia]|uniref:Uncharacterized protein n=1 Tax=Bythopirellula polymerisocia TaxID=2528003 RepID=A0A5C6CZM4_9BACT|nr:hypothetical protein [Bythopirellula polymerisocia]TWU30092.1 hypothetical protein Pla144_08780 [Bythopirellula polymerisocia]